MTHRKNSQFSFSRCNTFHICSFDSPISKNNSSLLSDKLLRFRVLADSDSSIDQYEKNELSKKMITLLSPALSNIKTKEEALTLLRESLPFKCLLQLCAVRLWRTKLRLLHTRFPSLSL